MAKRCKVFISYSHEDEVLKDSKVKKDAGYPRAFLSRLCAAIAAHDGLLTKDEIFFDDARLAAEPAWRPAIETALDECGLLIFLVSPHSLVSEFCMRTEVARAMERGINVITVLLRPSHDWYRVKVRNPKTGESKELGEWHSGGLPKFGGNAKPVSAWGQDEEAAWEEVCKAIVEFMKDNPFGEPGDVQPASAHEGSAVAINAGPLQVDERDITRNAQLLRRHLHKAWRSLDRNPEFVDDPLFDGLAKPLTVEAIMARVVDLEKSSANLVWVGDALGRFWGKPESSAMRAVFLRILLVVADSFIQDKKGAAQPAAHQPIWVREALISAMIAAQQQNFGLALNTAKRQPDSVFPAIPPAVELGMPGEFGPCLVHREVMRVIKRQETGKQDKFDQKTVKATVDLTKKRYESDIAVRVDADGDYVDPLRRQLLSEYLQGCGIHTFFVAAGEQGLPPEGWRNVPMGSLIEAFDDAFPAEKALSKSSATEAAVRAIRLSLQRLVSDIFKRPDVSLQRDELLHAVLQIQELITAELTESKASCVKRCLGEAENVLLNLSAQDPLRETLNSIRDGLKAVWPDLLKLMS